MSHILIVEDEPDMREGLRINLEGEGHSVDLAAEGTTGLERARSPEVDLIVLDLMLPGISGLEVLRTLRSEGVSTPIVMLTARGLETDKVLGLKMGADDYVTKPFSVRELAARIEAVLRRTVREPDSSQPDSEPTYRFADVEVDVEARQVTKAGVPVSLSYKEFELLRVLIDRRGHIVTRAALLDQVWGYDEAALPSTRTVDTHIANLRRKLEGDEARGRYLRTVHKVGYRFEPDD